MIGCVVGILPALAVSGPAPAASVCSTMLDRADVRTSLGDTWAVDGRCGETALWDVDSRPWVLGRQKWFVDSQAPDNRTGLMVFPARMSLAAFFQAKRYGAHAVVKHKSYIVSRDESLPPGEYTWSVYGRAADSLFAVTSLPTRASAIDVMRLQRQKLR